jgi:hypothetical protein
MGRLWLAGLVVWGVVAVASGPASAGQCYLISGTGDGLDKNEAVDESHAALTEAIDSWKADHHVTGSIATRPAKPSPDPYWRDKVASDLYVKPDVVDGRSYTICWHGVVSPVVCTSGARFCR